MASRCQVAHDFTQRHVLAACGEAAIPDPRYLLVLFGTRPARGPLFQMLTCRLSLECL